MNVTLKCALLCCAIFAVTSCCSRTDNNANTVNTKCPVVVDKNFCENQCVHNLMARRSQFDVVTASQHCKEHVAEFRCSRIYHGSSGNRALMYPQVSSIQSRYGLVDESVVPAACTPTPTW